MRRFSLSLVVLTLALLFSGICRAGDALFQYATIDTLLAGLYDGRMTLEALKFQGDFGLGTLNGLDGELVVLEGQAYHIKAGGKASIPADSTCIPFATVSFFDRDISLKLGNIGSLDELNRAVFKAIPSRNLFCAIRIDGDFSMVKTRAIPRQKPPYRPLAQVVKQQVIVKFSGPGTLVGYYSPSLSKGVNVPGFHWHFLTGDRSGGGHVLDLAMAPATASLDVLHNLTVRLPDDRAFDRLDLSGDQSGALHAVEQNPTGKQ